MRNSHTGTSLEPTSNATQEKKKKKASHNSFMQRPGGQAERPAPNRSNRGKGRCGWWQQPPAARHPMVWRLACAQLHIHHSCFSITPPASQPRTSPTSSHPQSQSKYSGSGGAKLMANMRQRPWSIAATAARLTTSHMPP